MRGNGCPVSLLPRCPLETFLVITTRGSGATASSGQRPGMQLNILRRTGQPPPQQSVMQPHVPVGSGLGSAGLGNAVRYEWPLSVPDHWCLPPSASSSYGRPLCLPHAVSLPAHVPLSPGRPHAQNLLYPNWWLATTCPKTLLLTPPPQRECTPFSESTGLDYRSHEECPRTTRPRALCLGFIIFILPAPLSNVCVPIPLAGLSLERKLLPDQVLTSTERAPSTLRVCARGCEGKRINGRRLQSTGENDPDRRLMLTETGQMPQGDVFTKHQWSTKEGATHSNSEKMAQEEQEMRQRGSEGVSGFSPGRGREAFQMAGGTGC